MSCLTWAFSRCCFSNLMIQPSISMALGDRIEMEGGDVGLEIILSSSSGFSSVASSSRSGCRWWMKQQQLEEIRALEWKTYFERMLLKQQRTVTWSFFAAATILSSAVMSMLDFVEEMEVSAERPGLESPGPQIGKRDFCRCERELMLSNTAPDCGDNPVNSL